MLGSSGPATATIHTSTNSATPSSPTRPSRLRGLSYLRNYTHNHLHGSSSQRAEQQQQLQQHRQQQQVQVQQRRERPAVHRRSISYPAESSSSNVGTSRSGSQSGIQSSEGGWVPTVQGRSGLSRQAIDLTSTDTQAAQRETSESPVNMTRARASTVVAPLGTGASADAGMPSSSTPPAKETQPTIRFIPHVETRSSRPSLHFSAISRTLKNASTIVRVGRYSERDTPTAEENSLPVGFKSKVVSRRHCEFWCASGQWYVKDVKSSSGTFLNHVRLSSPGIESRPYPVNDGDVVQLGIDFKGGEEVIFRCVKIRVECNRGWQKSLNNFNTTTHKRLLKSAGINKNRDSDAASVNSSECSICLNPVAPCQALFVAPCSHVWHYKCVRNLINGPNWPNFLCPNCRFVADLEADVEPPEEEEVEEYEELPTPFADAEEGADLDQSGETGVSSDDAVDSSNGGEGNITDDSTNQQTPGRERPRDTLFMPMQLDNLDRTANITDEELAGLAGTITLEPPTPIEPTERSPFAEASSSMTPPLAISSSASKNRAPPPPDLISARSATPTSTTPFALAASIISEGPLTPRNNAGPYVLDGAAGRERGAMDSLAGTVMSEHDELELEQARRT
jgi:pSer/pThr/pTyr-binding forkhead associated (FHA) protein